MGEAYELKIDASNSQGVCKRACGLCLLERRILPIHTQSKRVAPHASHTSQWPLGLESQMMGPQALRWLEDPSSEDREALLSPRDPPGPHLFLEGQL